MRLTEKCRDCFKSIASQSSWLVCVCSTTIRTTRRYTLAGSYFYEFFVAKIFFGDYFFRGYVHRRSSYLKGTEEYAVVDTTAIEFGASADACICSYTTCSVRTRSHSVDRELFLGDSF